MFARLMGLKTISPRTLSDTLRDQPVTVIDVNSRSRWIEGHVPGAVNLDPAEFAADDLPEDRDASIVFYCSNVMCTKAPRAAQRAEAMGYRDVRVMSAGIKGWVSTQLPTENGT